MAEPQVHNRPFTWEFVVSILENRLAMWVGSATYERAVGLVMGFDMAQPESIGPRMHHRASLRSDIAQVVGWQGVLMAEASEGDDHKPRTPLDMTPEQNAKAITLLAGELRAALTDDPSL